MKHPFSLCSIILEEVDKTHQQPSVVESLKKIKNDSNSSLQMINQGTNNAETTLIPSTIAEVRIGTDVHLASARETTQPPFL